MDFKDEILFIHFQLSVYFCRSFHKIFPWNLFVTRLKWKLLLRQYKIFVIIPIFAKWNVKYWKINLPLVYGFSLYSFVSIRLLSGINHRAKVLSLINLRDVLDSLNLFWTTFVIFNSSGQNWLQTKRIKIRQFYEIGYVRLEI